MIDKKKLDEITEWLKESVFRNDDLNYNDELPDLHLTNDIDVDIVDVIATLHNYLYESVTGDRYNYAAHWCNKIGAWCNDNIFDDDFADTIKQEITEYQNIFYPSPEKEKK